VKKSVATVILALNPLLWASFYTVTKKGLSREEPVSFSFFELSSLLPIAVAILLMERKRLAWRVVKRGLVLGSILYAAVFASTLALNYTQATHTAFYPSFNGFFAALIAWGLKKEPISKVTWSAGILSAAGTLLLVLESGGGYQLVGEFIALAAALLYTAYIFAVDQEGEQNPTSPWPVLGIELITLAIASGIVACLWNGGTVAVPKSESIALILYVGVATTFLPTAISLTMQQHVRPVTVAFLYVTEPIICAIFAHWFLGEQLTWYGYLGGAVIFLGAGMQTWHACRNTGSAKEDMVARAGQ
jgi:drug/metabolite transporter (DMT)-like permease